MPTNSRNVTMVLLTVTSALGFLIEILSGGFLHSAQYGVLIVTAGFVAWCYSFVSGVGSLFYYQLTNRSWGMKLCLASGILLAVVSGLVLGMALFLWLADWD